MGSFGNEPRKAILGQELGHQAAAGLTAQKAAQMINVRPPVSARDDDHDIGVRAGDALAGKYHEGEMTRPRPNGRRTGVLQTRGGETTAD